MTASIRAPKVVAAAALLASLSVAARADLVILTDGAHLKVASYEVQGDFVRLELADGGRMRLSIERIDRVMADEVIEREAERDRPVPPPPAFSLRFVDGQERPDTPYGDPIYESARRHGLNPILVAAVVEAESRFNAHAVSKKGARGLMQLMPATGRRLGLGPAELYEPEKNLDAGSRYLRQLLDRFGELDLVLAAYNAGEGAVERHGGVPPYRETIDYVRKVSVALGLVVSGGVGGV